MNTGITVVPVLNISQQRASTVIEANPILHYISRGHNQQIEGSYLSITSEATPGTLCPILDHAVQDGG